MPDGHSDDYYGLLGVPAGATASELRRAWRRLAARWHPDRAGSRATKMFQALQAAYEVLSDPVARAEYDRQRGVGGQGPELRQAPAVLLERLSGPLNALLTCGAVRRVSDDVIELFPNAQEAAEGGMITIAMRVPVRKGAGITEELFAAWLALPPGVADGAILTPSAMLPGMVQPILFRVRLPRSVD